MKVLRFINAGGGEYGECKCVFDFPFEAARDVIFKGRYRNKLLDELLAQSSNDPEIVEVDLCGLHIKWLTDSTSFTVLCVPCNTRFARADLRVERWSYDRGFLAQGTGRNWYCPNGHTLVSVTDAIS